MFPYYASMPMHVPLASISLYLLSLFLALFSESKLAVAENGYKAEVN